MKDKTLTILHNAITDIITNIDGNKCYASKEQLIDALSKYTDNPKHLADEMSMQLMSDNNIYTLAAPFQTEADASTMHIYYDLLSSSIPLTWSKVSDVIENWSIKIKN